MRDVTPELLSHHKREKKDETMNTWRANIPVVALVLLAAGALSGCARSLEVFIDDEIKPLVYSVEEEYCMVPNVLGAYGSSVLRDITGYLNTFYVEILSEEEKAKSLFCTQNLAGVVLITDRVMNQALGEMEAGVPLAIEALDLNVAGQQDTLARITRIKNLSLGQKLDPKYVKELRRIEKDIGALATAAEEGLEKLLAESKRIPPAAQAKLEEAHGHLVNLRHYQGKAMAGFVIFDAARETYGTQVLYEAFVHAIRLDVAMNKTSDKKFATTEKLVTAFLKALPKFTETTIAGAKLSSAIWDAADTSGLKDALRAANEPSPAATNGMVTYAADVKDSTLRLGSVKKVEGLGTN